VRAPGPRSIERLARRTLWPAAKGDTPPSHPHKKKPCRRLHAPPASAKRRVPPLHQELAAPNPCLFRPSHAPSLAQIPYHAHPLFRARQRDQCPAPCGRGAGPRQGGLPGRGGCRPDWASGGYHGLQHGEASTGKGVVPERARQWRKGKGIARSRARALSFAASEKRKVITPLYAAPLPRPHLSLDHLTPAHRPGRGPVLAPRYCRRRSGRRRNVLRRQRGPPGCGRDGGRGQPCATAGRRRRGGRRHHRLPPGVRLLHRHRTPAAAPARAGRPLLRRCPPRPLLPEGRQGRRPRRCPAPCL